MNDASGAPLPEVPEVDRSRAMTGDRNGATIGGRYLRRPRPERVFALLVLPFGLFFAVAHPPLDPPDEIRHLARAYLVAGGRWLPPGRAAGHDAWVPRSLAALHPMSGGASLHPRHDPGDDGHSRERLLENLSRPLAPHEGRRMLRMSFVSPLAYAAALVGVAPARWLEAPAGWVLYAGRLASLAGYIALGVLAIRTTPIRKWAFVLIAATPMSVYTAASISSDPLTTSTVLLFVAFVLRKAFAAEERVTRGSIAALWLACAALGAMKTGYAPIAALVALIPADRFAGRSQRCVTVVGAVGISAVATMLWAVLLQTVDGVGAENFADPAAQLRQIVAHPVSYVGVMAVTVILQIVPFVAGFVGVLGQLDIALPLVFYAIYPLGIAAACLCDPHDPPTLDRRRRGGVAALFAFCTVGVLTMGYLGWNEVGAPLIVGVQGRYFAPLAPLLLLVLPGLGRCRAWAPLGVVSLGGVTLLAAALATWLHDYP